MKARSLKNSMPVKKCHAGTPSHIVQGATIFCTLCIYPETTQLRTVSPVAEVPF